LWEQSGEEHLLKQAILTLLTRLINSLKQDSQPFHRFFLPLIKYSLDPSSEAYLYLLEEALELWQAVLQATTGQLPSELLELAPSTIPVLDSGTVNFKKATEILESYLLLAPYDIISSGLVNGLLPVLKDALGPSLGSEATGDITGLLELLIRSAAVLGEAVLKQVAELMVESGLFAKILGEVHKNWKTNQEKNPPVIDSFVETDYLNVIARLILSDPSLFIAMLELAAPAEVGDLGPVFEMRISWLLTEWFENFENMTLPQHRKLQCLALTKLLETNEDWILSKMQDLLTVWTDVIGEVRESDGTE
jgi:hypothetical protein